MSTTFRILLLLSFLLTACSAYPAQGKVLDKYRTILVPPGLAPRVACFASVRGHGHVRFPCDGYAWVDVGAICEFYNRYFFYCVPPGVARAGAKPVGPVNNLGPVPTPYPGIPGF
jgi:hypothetical protein